MVIVFLMSVIIGWLVASTFGKGREMRDSTDSRLLFLNLQWEASLEQSKWEINLRNIEYEMEQSRIDAKFKRDRLLMSANHELESVYLMCDHVETMHPIEKLEYLDKYCYYMADFAIKEKNPFSFKMSFEQFIAFELGKPYCFRGFLFKPINTKIQYE